MPGLKWRAACAGLAFGWLASSSALPQAAPGTGPVPRADPNPSLIPRTHEERERRFLTEHRIVLNVEVSDATGRMAPDLSQADFTVLDNEQPLKLVSFAPVKGSTAKPPPHVIVVLDAVNNSGRRLHSFERDLREFLKQGEGPLAYPFAIGILTGSRIDVGDSSQDRNVLLADLATRTSHLEASGCIADQLRGDFIDPSHLYAGVGERLDTPRELICMNERFVSSVTALQELARMQVDIPGRVILIWMGSGWPLLTSKSFKADDSDLKRNYFAWLVELSDELREAQVTVDGVESPDDTSSAESYARGTDFFDGVKNQEQMKAGDLGLHALVHQTGGHILTDQRDLPGEIRTCTADANAYYVLKFDSPIAADFGEYHSLAVEVSKPDLSVRTNTLYYAEQ